MPLCLLRMRGRWKVCGEDSLRSVPDVTSWMAGGAETKQWPWEITSPPNPLPQGEGEDQAGLVRFVALW
jgi:hypothetical protein